MKVGLFIPCYINAIYPQVGVASYKLLKNLGVDVDYPLDQTCCGQPMANAGFQDESLKMAIRFDDLFRKYDYIVGPSASCVAFVKENHPGILAKEGHQCQSAGKIYDLCAFIHDVIKPTKIPARFPHKVSIHNSCHGVRELFLSAPSELNIPYGEFYQFNLSSCIRQQNSLTAQFVSFNLSNLANIFYPPPNFYNN